MRPNARKPVVRRTKPTWARAAVPETDGDDVEATGAPAAPAATPRLTLSKVANLRDDAAARVGAAPKRVVALPVETKPTPRAARAAALRTGPSLLDHAADSIGYIRTDLTRIAVLAAVMVGVIVVLSFVLA